MAFWGPLLEAAIPALLESGGQAASSQKDTSGQKLDEEMKREKRIESEVAQQSTYPEQVMKSNYVIDQILAEMGPAYAPLRFINFANLYGQALPYYKAQSQLNLSRFIDPFSNAYKTTENRQRKFNRGWEKIAGMFGNVAKGGARTIGNMLNPGDQRGLF